MPKFVAKLTFLGFPPLYLVIGKSYFSKLFVSPSVFLSTPFWHLERVLIQRTTAYFWFLATALFYRIDCICFMVQALMNNVTEVRHYEYDYLHKAAALLPFTHAGHNWIPQYYKINFVMHAKRIWSAVSFNLKVTGYRGGRGFLVKFNRQERLHRCTPRAVNYAAWSQWYWQASQEQTGP